MRRAVYPGSFDPVTWGHQKIVQRISGVFDEVVILVADNLKKNYLFSQEERVQLVEKACEDIPNVKVQGYRGLTTNFAKENDIKVIVRSLRGSSDWDLESTMAQANKKLDADIETMFIMTQPELAHISSSFVKEIAANQGELESFVPKHVELAIKEKINQY